MRTLCGVVKHAVDRAGWWLVGGMWVVGATDFVGQRGCRLIA